MQHKNIMDYMIAFIIQTNLVEYTHEIHISIDIQM